MRFVTTCLFVLFSTALHAASFDCAKARSTSEKLICNTPHLSILDEDLFQVYKAARSAVVDWQESYPNGQTPSEWFKSDGRQAWLQREATCQDVTCLEIWYTERRALLQWIATAKDHLGDYGLKSLVSLPTGDVLISYGMATHDRNVVFEKATQGFKGLPNGEITIVDSRLAPLLIQQSKRFLNEGGAIWVDLQIDTDGVIYKIPRPKHHQTCVPKSDFIAMTSFSTNDLDRVEASEICFLR